VIQIGGKAVKGYGQDRGGGFQDCAQLFPWRTALDTAVLEAIGRAQPHPRLGIVSGQGARLFPCERLAEALRGATLVVVAVTSPAALLAEYHVGSRNLTECSICHR